MICKKCDWFGKTQCIINNCKYKLELLLSNQLQNKIINEKYRNYSGKITCPFMEAIVENADFDINVFSLIWYNGIFHYGNWFNGNWQGGIWHNGNWLNGKWYNGEWKNISALYNRTLDIFIASLKDLLGRIYFKVYAIDESKNFAVS